MSNRLLKQTNKPKKHDASHFLSYSTHTCTHILYTEAVVSLYVMCIFVYVQDDSEKCIRTKLISFFTTNLYSTAGVTSQRAVVGINITNLCCCGVQ